MLRTATHTAHHALVWCLALAAAAVSLLAVATPANATTTPVVNQRIVHEAARHIGQRYVEGATGPTRFDCSGLVLYTYRKEGVHGVPRTANQQYHAARRISSRNARPGDLVFYHDRSGYVYHVAIYTGHSSTIVAANFRQGVIREHIWDPHATFGTFTHR